MNEYYSIQDVVTMTMLSERTVRTHIKEGRLSGEKVDGVWRFTPEEVGEFFELPAVRQTMRANRNGMVYDVLLDEGKKEPSCCMVLDLPVEDQKTLCEGLLDRVNREEGLTFVYHYNDKKKMARVILVGEPGRVAAIAAWCEDFK